MEKKWCVLLWVVLFCVPIQMKAQKIEKDNVPEKNIQGRADMLYRIKNYQGCLSLLNKVELHGADAQKTEYLILLCNFELRTGHTDRLLEEFRRKYPFTAFSYELSYLEANMAFEHREWKRAATLFGNLPSAFIKKEWERNYSYRLALSHLFSGNLAEAEMVLKNFPTNDPYYSNAVGYYSSYVNYTQGKYDAALEGFLKLTEVEEFKSLAAIYVAQIYYLQRDTEKAIAYGEESLTKYKEKQVVDEMTRIVGESYYLKGNYEQSIQLLDRYLTGAEKALPSAWFAYGASLYNIQAYSKALAPLSKGIAGENAQTQAAQYYLGLCYVRQNDTRNALMAFEVAARMDFDKEIKEYAMYNNALLLYQGSYSGFDGAAVVFERFMQEFPTSLLRESLSEYLVEVYSTTKNYKQAITSIEKIKYPTPVIQASKQRLYYQKGVEEVVNADYSQSIQSFTSAIKLSNLGNALFSDSYYWRGEAYYRLGNFGKAAADYSSFVKHTDKKSGNTYAMAYYNQGYAYFKLGNFGAALVAFNKFTDNIVRKDDPVYGDGINRIGDCYFAQRNFAEAERYFLLSARLAHPAVDYALYQQAMMQGYLRKVGEKNQTLDRLLATFPHSSLADDALFEKGRTHIADSKNALAVSAFDRLLKNFPESPFCRKALLQKAFAYRNEDNTQEAMEAYKEVIRAYPNSEEALVANSDLKSMAQDVNRVNEYVDFINSLGGVVKFSASEQDSLVYFAAEKQYLKSDLKGARKSMTAYIQSFPNGAFSVAALFYLGRIAEKEHNYDEALTHFLTVVNEPESKYTEEALRFVADNQLKRGEYADAYTRYMQLSGVASSQEVRIEALMGMLRSSFEAGRYSEMLQVVSKLEAESSLLPEQVKERKLLTAKLFFAEKAPFKAEGLLKDLSSDTRDRFGAEAKYLLADTYFHQKELVKAEGVILSYIEQGTAHQYWLARTFILYSDVLIQQKKEFEAKQYLTSLKSSYTANDDIQTMISTRLNKMK